MSKKQGRPDPKEIGLFACKAIGVIGGIAAVAMGVQRIVDGLSGKKCK